MKKNPTYKFYQYRHRRMDGTECIRIAAVSSFAGKMVKGYADCHPDENFDEEYGKALAMARCAKKIASKRVKYADSKVVEALDLFHDAFKDVIKMNEYFDAAITEKGLAEDKVEELLNEKYGNG